MSNGGAARRARASRPEALGNRALFPTARIPGHGRRRVRIPSERQLVRGRTTSADRAVLVGFLGWIGFILVDWAFDLGVSGLVRLAALPVAMLAAGLFDVLLLQGDRGRSRWFRWARARGLRPISSRGLRAAPVGLLRKATLVPVVFVGNVGGYRLAVGAACAIEEGAGPGERPARFRTFVYATLPPSAVERVPRLVAEPRRPAGFERPEDAGELHRAGHAPPGRDVLVRDGADDTVVEGLLDSGIAALLREQPHVGVEQEGPHLVVWSPSTGSYGRVLRHYADPDIEPELVDALCDVAVHIVRRYVDAGA